MHSAESALVKTVAQFTKCNANQREQKAIWMSNKINELKWESELKKY